ncbi:MAG: DUF6020 family protein [Bifidobacteriaceae bacterium]|jgi:hypothetical protein|nr:DUF6020 family protein [Bifidobacteriaceae bacterium]
MALANAIRRGLTLGLHEGLKRVGAWLTGAVYAGVTVAGWQLSHHGSVRFDSPWTWLALAVLTPVFTLAVAVASEFVMSRARAVKEEPAKSLAGGGAKHWRITGWRATALRAAVIWCLWLPLWLAVYPGFFAYDANTELNYVLDHSINSHHPPLHVWILGYGVKWLHSLTGQWNYAIAIWILIQAALVAVCFAWSLGKLEGWGSRRWVIRVAWAYYALFPTVAMFALCSTKDTLYSAALLVAFMLFVDLGKGRQGWRFYLAVGLVSAAVLLLRLNAIWAFVPFAAICVAVSRGRRLALCLVLGVPVLVTLFATEVLYPKILHYGTPSFAVKLAVPAQQMARLYGASGDGLTAAERQAVERWFPNLPGHPNYVPFNGDPTKGVIDGDAIEREPLRFVKDWVRLGLDHPAVYVNAALANTYQGWYPGAAITGYNYAAGPLYNYSLSGTSYFIFKTESPGEMSSSSVLAPVRNFYKGISHSYALSSVPVVSWMFSPGALIMLMVAVLALAMRRRGPGRAMFLPVLLLGLMMGTIYLGPVMLVRYFLPMFFIFPVMAAFFANPAVFAPATRVPGPPPARGETDKGGPDGPSPDELAADMPGDVPK